MSFSIIQSPLVPPIETVFLPAGGRSIKRKRRMLSCVTCRSRRVKCDKAQPACGRCVGNGSEQCVYVNCAVKDVGNVEDQRSSKNRRTENAHCQDDAAGISAQPREQNKTFAENKHIGHLSVSGGGKSKYVSAGFWACVGSVEEHIDELLQSQHKPLTISLDHDYCHEGPNLFAQYSISDKSQGMWRGPGNLSSTDVIPGLLERLIKGLPPKETCDLLCKEYFVRVHAILPIIHGPSFEKQYRMLWLSWPNEFIENIRSGIMAKNPSFLALLYAVLFAASTTASAGALKPHFNGATTGSVSLTLLSLTKASLSLVSFPERPALDSLSAFLVSQNMLMREEEAITTCSFVGIALRVAQGMGFHRDGSNFNLDPTQAEVKRRVWWHIIHTDVMTSIGCGLPPIWVDDGCHDTRMISERQDGFENYARATPMDDENLNDVRFIVAVGRYSITTILRHLLRRLLDIELFGEKDMINWRQKINVLSKQIDDRIKRLKRLCSSTGSGPETLRPSSIDQTTSSTPDLTPIFQLDSDETKIFCDWGTCLLRLMVEKAFCMMYQPLIRHPSSSLWQEVRSESIQHCHSFLDIFLTMCDNDSFHSYHWLYPGTYQALQPIAVILADLCQQPDSPEATKSRQLIDQVFIVLGPDGRLATEENDVLMGRRFSTAGTKAWSILSRMKQKAWAKAGLDPDVLWITQSRSNRTARDSSRSKPLDESQPEQHCSANLQSHHQEVSPRPSIELQPKLHQGNGTSDNVLNDDGIPAHHLDRLDHHVEEHYDGAFDTPQNISISDTGGSLSDFNFPTNNYFFDWNEWSSAFPDSGYSFDDIIPQ